MLLLMYWLIAGLVNYCLTYDSFTRANRREATSSERNTMLVVDLLFGGIFIPIRILHKLAK